MQFESVLHEGVFIEREQTLATVATQQKKYKHIFCPNAGKLNGLAVLGSRVWYSNGSPHHAYQQTWELVEVDAGHKVLVNQYRIQPLLKETIEEGHISALVGYKQVPDEEDPTGSYWERGKEKCLVKVQPITFDPKYNGKGCFPEQVSTRLYQKIEKLIAAKSRGERALLVLCALHTGIQHVAFHPGKDKEFTKLLYKAQDVGVEIYAIGARINLSEIHLDRALPLLFPLAPLSH